jgi:hypothetical protein
MVKRENIDSGYPNFQLDTRDSGSRRNLDYLFIRRTLSECKEDNPHMSQDVDKQRRDAELDRAIEKYLRACMAAGLTKEEALERLYELTKETAVEHRRSQFKIVSRE